MEGIDFGRGRGGKADGDAIAGRRLAIAGTRHDERRLLSAVEHPVTERPEILHAKSAERCVVEFHRRGGTSLAPIIACENTPSPEITAIKFLLQTYCCSEHDDRSDALAGVHEVEALVYLVEGQDMGDHGIDLNLAVHVPVDDLWYVGTALGATKGGAAPVAAGNELEWPRADFLARLRHADGRCSCPSRDGRPRARYA